jgi:hypothetical protein
MTNEELAIAVRDGQTELMPELWGKVRRFIRRQAVRRLLCEPLHLRDLEEDLTNSGYFALSDAVRGFRDDAETSFLHYLNFHLKKAFNAALGARSEKGKREPLHRAMSLNAPIGGETDDLTLSDMLIDPLAEEELKAVDEEDYRRGVNAFLREAITRTCAGAEQELLLSMLEHNVGIATAAQIIGIEPKKAYDVKDRATRKVRMYMRGAGKRACDDLDIGNCKGVGVASWRNRMFTSVTEAEAVRRADTELLRRRLAGYDKTE